MTFEKTVLVPVDAVKDIEAEDALEMLTILTNGRRLKDISDFPLDLAV